MARPGIVLHRTHRLSAGSWLLSVCFLITAACSSSSSSKLDSGPDSVVAVGTGGRLSGTGGTAAGTGGNSGGADGST